VRLRIAIEIGRLMATVEVGPKSITLLDRKLARSSRSSGQAGIVVFVVSLAASLCYITFHVARDLDSSVVNSYVPYALLGAALLIALGFEFVNGFHDTANAVAPVIYTHSLEPNLAVVWSGFCNLAGVLFATGTVAFAVVALLPVELILQVSSGAGFSMVFALLLAAILWNLGTWWFGLPASSSHTLVGSIIGVGLTNQLLSPHTGASGVDWGQAVKVLKALLISPLLGFTLAGLLILVAKALLKFPELYRSPKNEEPPPLPIRALMVVTCTGVSFFHGSNDGQKGMGLIMLILIGTVPTAYALNHTMGPAEVQQFITASEQAGQVLDRHIDPRAIVGANARDEVTDYIRTRHLRSDTVVAMRQLVVSVGQEAALYKDFKSVPPQEQANVRNNLYVVSEGLRLMDKADAPAFSREERSVLVDYRSRVDHATKFIPSWVKVAVALALGLGTMIGWKRIVITVGEKIGKQDLTYAQGASAGLVAMGTIFVADKFGLPVSTTHILSSGVAGTMAANGSGLRLSTIRNIAAGWVLTLPAAALLSGSLYWLFRHLL